MKNQDQNLFIVEDNAEAAVKLHKFLQSRFGTIYSIFTFENAVQALTKVDKHTSIIILDYDYFGDEGNKIVNFIKNINDKTKVIILANNDDIGSAIDNHHTEADNVLKKGKGVQRELSAVIIDYIAYPAKYLEFQYGFSQFFSWLIFLCVIIGILVFIGMWILPTDLITK